MYRKMFKMAAEEVDKNAAVDCVACGTEALDKIRCADYDIIVADIEIPGLGIVDLLTKIMMELPRTFVLLTARPSPANSALCAEALAKCAAECMTKPIYNSYGENFDIVKRELAVIFKSLNEERRKEKDRKKDKKTENNDPAKIKKHMKKIGFHPEIVLIAASTGGPMALEKILSELSGDFPVPVLIVQHMPMHFTETMVKRLDRESQLKVKVAEDGETLKAGTAYAAPGGLHMKVDRKNRILLDRSPPLNGVRPAADALFESVAELFRGSGVLAVILTGMGSDGQKGIAELKEKRDCFCLAQSEKTCVVYGMPRSVVENGLADKVLDLDKIPQEIESFDFKAAGLFEN